ncbi:hypothetical protein MLD38_033325 [Melastoma candidum]|uniref:Uncharacterized protein n=1 Tax=Melastoma candidum TaxID=119954 RepID=A0ACB9M6W1_9MYRT|nr:hypothetical protein MLD38_033325 [Melastoma candidum]
MNFNNMKVPKVPRGGAASSLFQLGVLGSAGLYAAANSLYNVEGRHGAIMSNCLSVKKLDEKTSVSDRGIGYPEGTHIMIPWFERPIIYDVRARPRMLESTSGSCDLQVKIGLRVLTCPVPDELLLYIHNASQLITQREVAAQEAERTELLWKKAEQDKRSAIIKAQGEAVKLQQTTRPSSPGGG